MLNRALQDVSCSFSRFEDSEWVESHPLMEKDHLKFKLAKLSLGAHFVLPSAKSCIFYTMHTRI